MFPRCHLILFALTVPCTLPLRAQSTRPSPDTAQIGPSPLESVAAPTEEDLRNVQITLSAPKHEFNLLEPVPLTVEVRNLADNDLPMPIRRDKAKDFPLIVRDERGKLVSLTRAGHRLYDRPPIERIGGPANRIRKGHPAAADLFANLIYDLTLPGTYQVTAFCYVGQRNGNKVVRIESAPIKITVRPTIVNQHP